MPVTQFRVCDRCRTTTDHGAAVGLMRCPLAGRIWLCGRCTLAHAERCPVCLAQRAARKAA